MSGVKAEKGHFRVRLVGYAIESFQGQDPPATEVAMVS